MDLVAQDAILDAVASRLDFIGSQFAWLEEELNTGDPPAEVTEALFYMATAPVTVSESRRFFEATGR